MRPEVTAGPMLRNFKAENVPAIKPDVPGSVSFFFWAMAPEQMKKANNKAGKNLMEVFMGVDNT